MEYCWCESLAFNHIYHSFFTISGFCLCFLFPFLSSMSKQRHVTARTKKKQKKRFLYGLMCLASERENRICRMVNVPCQIKNTFIFGVLYCRSHNSYNTMNDVHSYYFAIVFAYTFSFQQILTIFSFYFFALKENKLI